MENKWPSIKTRASIIRGLCDEDDAESWQWFYDNYSPMLVGFCRSLRIKECDTDEIVQDTVISVIRAIKTYNYQPETCKFRSWLFMLTKRRIADFQRKAYSLSARSTESLDSMPKGEIPNLSTEFQQKPNEAQWNQNWIEFVEEQAKTNLKRQTRADHFQIFDLTFNKEMDATEVSELMDISKAKVYLIKHRMLKKLREEVKVIEEGRF